MNTPLPPWLERSYDKVKATIDEGQLASALLVDSAPGWGEQELAQRISQAILGIEADRSPEGNLDYLNVVVQERSTRISIEQIRDAIEFLSLTARESLRRLVVIEKADKLTIPASHALLKVLEEPPSNNHLLMVTTNFSLLLPTIRSRCQRVTVSKGSDEEVSEFLASQDLDRKALDEFLADYGGAPYAALSAIRANRTNLTEQLADAARRRAPIPTIVDRLKEEDVDDLLMRWQYVTLRLARNSAVLAPVARFYEDLSDKRRQFTEIPGLDRNRQFVRLMIKWRDLIRQHARLPRRKPPA